MLSEAGARSQWSRGLERQKRGRASPGAWGPKCTRSCEAGGVGTWKRETTDEMGAWSDEGIHAKLQEKSQEGMIWADVHPKGNGCEEETTMKSIRSCIA